MLDRKTYTVEISLELVLRGYFLLQVLITSLKECNLLHDYYSINIIQKFSQLHFLGNLSDCRNYNAEHHPVKSYIKNNCSLNCTCVEVQNNEYKEQCTQLCSFSNITCSNGTRLEFYLDDVPGSQCKCRKPRCVNGMFIYLFP